MEIIRASYRTLMRELKNHPDLGGSTSEASILNEAYETLSDPKLRAAYDKKIRATRFKKAAAALSPDSAPSDAVHDALRKVVRRGQAFRLIKIFIVIECHEVGKRAADINCKK